MFWCAIRKSKMSGKSRFISKKRYRSHSTCPIKRLTCFVWKAIPRRNERPKSLCSDTAFECYGVQLIYSGSWQITAEVGNAGTVRLQGGINETAFCWKLGAGETFTTPQVALCYSAVGLGGLSRGFADFLRECVIDPKYAKESRPVLVNNWEATYFDFNYEKLFPIIDEAAKLGIDTFVLDDGWFGKRNWDDSSLGDWFVNTEKLPQGLTPIIAHCKEKGLKFGLWFEPEMISENSKLYRLHPDWAIGKQGQTPCRGRNQLVLDFSRRDGGLRIRRDEQNSFRK